MKPNKVKIESLMSKSAITIDIAASVQAAAQMITTQMVSCVVVVDQNIPVGVVTERDIASAAAVNPESGSLSETPVSEIMGTPLMVLRSSETLADALNLVERLSIRHIPVLNDSEDVVGVVTQTDLLRACRDLLAAASD